MMTTEWEPYDPARHRQRAGNYLFLLRPFHHSPYYAGETDLFKRRFDSDHGGLFRDSGRTFMRRLFISEATDRTHKGFGTAWDNANPEGGPDRARVHVPGDPTDSSLKAESVEYWLDEVVLLICQTTTKGERHLIEARVQDDIMAYYEALVGHTINWKIPPDSQLVGDRPSVPSPAPAILYSWRAWGKAVEANDFFRAVEIATFSPHDSG
jgi:hypothetical protein